MSELATSEYLIILFYNPNSPIGKQALAYATGEGHDVREVDILKYQFTGTLLKELADRLDVPVEGLINKKHPEFEKFKDSSFSDSDWINILRENTELIKEPIAIRGHQAMFVETPSDLSRL